MSFNAFQRRHHRATTSMRVVTVLVSPERWAYVFDRAAIRFTNAVAFDTTPLSRFLDRINVWSAPRNWLLQRSALLRWMDWKIRKTFWTIVWCGVAVFQLYPRRAAVPRHEKPIRLLSAKETYDDFRSPSLVVPETVPVPEKALGAEVGTQVVHFFQDLYPIVSTHQPDVHSDRQRRFDEAYTRLYRLTRDTPRWHPDLVEAERQGNLLGALAVGGPCAKLLHRVRLDGDDYVIDLAHFVNYPVRDGLCHMGTRIQYKANGGKLAVTGIHYEDEEVRPGSAKWALTERIALAALVTHLTVWRQGMEYHVGGLAAFPVLTHNYLPPAHPLRRLLAPHLTQWMTTSHHTHVTLRRRGFDVTGFAFPYDVILRYYDDGAKAFDIRRLDVVPDARDRGIPDSLDYPYLPQAARYYGIFEQYVRSYVEAYYSSDSAIASDPHARIWFESLDATLVRGIRHYVPDVTRENLIKLCTVLMYSASVAHTENSLTNYADFLPTTVRRDGRQQSVGEMQNTLNFQVLIATPVTQLLRDASHVALDQRGRVIMRRFRQDLLDLQEEMEAQPSRYWQLFPSEIEASVSC